VLQPSAEKPALTTWAFVFSKKKNQKDEKNIYVFFKIAI
jgi:hypothetical protein